MPLLQPMQNSKQFAAMAPVVRKYHSESQGVIHIKICAIIKTIISPELLFYTSCDPA